MIDELVARIANLEKRLENLSRIAQVAAVHEDRGLVDVIFEEHTLKEIPFMTMRAGADKTYWLPSVGELGELRAPSGDLGNAFFIPGVYYNGFPNPEQNTAIAKRIFRDGMEEEIDTDAHSRKYTTGDSENFIDRNKIEDTHGSSSNKIDGSETLLKRTEGTIKIDGSETEIKRDAGEIKQVLGPALTRSENKITTSVTEIKRKTGMVRVIVGTTHLDVSLTSIKGYIAGVGKISVTAGVVNVNGATFLGGATNMFTISGPVSYAPVPIT